jgi:hypothetical protein
MSGVVVRSQSPIILGHSGAAVSAAADTAENFLATIPVPAGWMGANGVLRIVTHWVVTNSANLKTARIRYSGNAGTVISSFGATTQPRLRVEGFVFNTSPTVQTTAGTTWAAAGNAVDASTSPAVDTTATTSIVLSVQKATAGETATLSNYIVELLRRS